MRAFSDRFVALVLAVGMLVALVPGAGAGPFEGGLPRFAADSFNETLEGIDEVAASGHSRAATVIGALQEGRLFFSAESKQVFVKETSGRLTDAATGRPLAGDAPADLAPVRLNNRVRRAIEAALERTGGNRSEAARLLGISRRKLVYRLKEYRGSPGDAGPGCAGLAHGGS